MDVEKIFERFFSLLLCYGTNNAVLISQEVEYFPLKRYLIKKLLNFEFRMVMFYYIFQNELISSRFIGKVDIVFKIAYYTNVVD